ncbi:MAG: hypothetical protein R2851_27915 [Caldilineaceae bacterium]
MTRILLLTGIETGGRERVAVFDRRMTLFHRDARADDAIICRTAPRLDDGSALVRRLVHADGARSTSVEIAGASLPDGHHTAWLTLHVREQDPATLHAALHHWHGDPADGAWALAYISFRMDAGSRARWTALAQWLQAQPDGRAALADFVL